MTEATQKLIKEAEQVTADRNAALACKQECAAALIAANEASIKASEEFSALNKKHNETVKAVGDAVTSELRATAVSG